MIAEHLSLGMRLTSGAAAQSLAKLLELKRQEVEQVRGFRYLDTDRGLSFSDHWGSVNEAPQQCLFLLTNRHINSCLFVTVGSVLSKLCVLVQIFLSLTNQNFCLSINYASAITGTTRSLLSNLCSQTLDFINLIT